MSKEHSYAYEAGYRDGSIHYELEHCPACKNIADLQEALEENAKLRDDLEFANNEWEKDSLEYLNLQAENAKLRELVKRYHRLATGTDELWSWQSVYAELRELGVEVDTGERD